MTDFKTYLNKFSKNSDSFQTHLSLTGGKYNVPDEEYDDFYKTYFNQLKNETKMHLVEKVKDSKFAWGNFSAQNENIKDGSWAKAEGDNIAPNFFQVQDSKNSFRNR